MDKYSQESLSFQTDKYVYTSTRLFQGATDSGYAFQMGMQEALEGPDSVEVWVDDLLHHSVTFEHFIEILEKVFIRLLKKNIYLSPGKSQLCSDSLTWCGRIISKEEISFDDTYIQRLVDISSPRTAQELQQFCCGVNWLRLSLPDIAEHMDPLQECLGKYAKSFSSGNREIKWNVKISQTWYSKILKVFTKQIL